MSEIQFKNPFIKSKIGDDKFDKGVKNHIDLTGVIIADDNPLTSMFIENRTAINSLYVQYSESRGKKALNLSQREGKTISVNQLVKNIKNFISLKEGIIKNKYRVGTPEYEEIYPLGKSEYNKATKKNIIKLFKRFIDSLSVHKADFDAALLAEAQALYDSLIKAMSSQSGKKGEVKDAASGTKELRRQLAVQMFKNLLLLLLINAENPEKVKDYYDENFIKHAAKVTQTVEQPVNN